MLRKNKLDIGAAGRADTGRIGVNHHAFNNKGVAGGNKISVALHLNNAYTAGGYLVEILQIAKAGDINMYALCGLYNAGTFRHADGNFVYYKIYHLSLRPPLNIP